MKRQGWTANCRSVLISLITLLAAGLLSAQDELPALEPIPAPAADDSTAAVPAANQPTPAESGQPGWKPVADEALSAPAIDESILNPIPSDEPLIISPSAASASPAAYESPVPSDPIIDGVFLESPISESPSMEATIHETPIHETPIHETQIIEGPFLDSPRSFETVVEPTHSESRLIESAGYAAPAYQSQPIQLPPSAVESSQVVIESPVSDFRPGHVAAPVSHAPIQGAPVQGRNPVVVQQPRTMVCPPSQRQISAQQNAVSSPSRVRQASPARYYRVESRPTMTTRPQPSTPATLTVRGQVISHSGDAVVRSSALQPNVRYYRVAPQSAAVRSQPQSTSQRSPLSPATEQVQASAQRTQARTQRQVVQPTPSIRPVGYTQESGATQYRQVQLLVTESYGGQLRPMTIMVPVDPSPAYVPLQPIRNSVRRRW